MLDQLLEELHPNSLGDLTPSRTRLGAAKAITAMAHRLARLAARDLGRLLPFFVGNLRNYWQVSGFGPASLASAPNRRRHFSRFFLVWFLIDQTCPEMGGFCGRTRRSLPHRLALLRLLSLVKTPCNRRMNELETDLTPRVSVRFGP
jgi:hypothetical protein